MFNLSSSFSQEKQGQEVVAKKGDGVYSILRKNGLKPEKYYEQFLELNKKNLNDENGLFVGRTYLLPPKIETEEVFKPDAKKSNNLITRSYPIFGKNYESVEIESNELKGAVYYLISGHGGPDPGAVEHYNGKLITEDEYAYDVTLRLARMLIGKGAKVYMIIKDKNDGIRDQDILAVDYDEVNHPNHRIPRSQKLRLRQRTETVNKLYQQHGKIYQRLVAIHVDSRSKGENIDVFLYHHENSIKGKKLAQNIHNTFRQKYAKFQPNRRYLGTVESRSDLYVVKNTHPAMTYIELGNIKSAKDQKRILDFENREALAKWISEGLLLDYEER